MNPLFAFINERDAPSVADQPAVQVRSWRLVEAGNGDRHLLLMLEQGSLRITSRIVGLNTETRALITESGRRYELMAPAEAGQWQLAVLATYAVRADLGDAVDISDKTWRQFAVGPASL